MMRTLSMVLMGASFLIPTAAEAQAASYTHPRVLPANTARLANCRAPGHGRAYVCRTESNVLYRYAGGVRRAVVRDWVVVEWGRMRLHPVRLHRHDGRIGEPVLRDMLGRDAVARIRDHGRRAGLRGPVRGTWHESLRYGAILTLEMQGREVAELLDFDRDGWVDQVLLRDPRLL